MLTRLGLRARLVPVVLVVALAATLAGAPSPARSSEGSAPLAAGVGQQRAAGLVQRIERLGIVDAVRELPRASRTTRFFRIWFRLPVRRAEPDGPSFTLRATLLHRGTGLPTVLATTGYDLATWNFPYEYEATRILRSNQVEVEHRFFAGSRPRNPDWHRQLTIRESAADQHRIVRALQRVYRRPWISTGASKGGMTMTYHRRFYPDDVAGTVAYVAPNDAVDSDDVYDEFQAGVGGAAYAGCRQALVRVQRRILGTDRAWFRSRLRDSAPRFSILGGPDRALEVAVIELYFAFWQYQDASAACAEVPGPRAARGRVWRWADWVLGWSYVSDRGLRRYVPYYFQAATELGAPAPYEDEVADLLRYPGHDVAPSFVPDWLHPLTFDPSAMADVDDWVRTAASRMLFVYGEHDPWSAEPFECGAAGKERQCYQRWVPDGDHGAQISLLPRAVRRAAVARVRQWAGLATTRAAIAAAERRTEDAGPTIEQRGAVPSR